MQQFDNSANISDGLNEGSDVNSDSKGLRSDCAVDTKKVYDITLHENTVKKLAMTICDY